jgi:hypothetical protein
LSAFHELFFTLSLLVFSGNSSSNTKWKIIHGRQTK